MKEKIISVLKLLFCFGIFMYISTFFNVILNFFGIDMDNLSLFGKTLLELIAAIVLTLISFLVYRKELVKDFKEFKNGWKSKVLFALKLFGIFMLIKFLASYVSVLIAELFNIDLTTSENQSAINILLGQFPLLIFFSAVFLAPLYEETLFRLGFRKCLEKKWIFIIVSGMLFGLIHIFPTDLPFGLALIQSVPYVTMGICLGYYYQKYDNICYSMLLHFYNNLFSIIVLLLTSFSSVV